MPDPAAAYPRRVTRILVRPPAAEDVPSWELLGWRAAPDFAWLAREHESFRELLAQAGTEVLEARGEPGNLDSIYVYDPVLVTPAGAILLRPGKEARRGEPDALARDLPLPILGRLEPPATAEGGDTVWLDARTLLVGRTYRTNDAGIEALRALLPAVDVLAFDLPHLGGADEVLHLRSLLSPLRGDLVVAHRPLLPARLVELLEARGIEVVGVPEDELETMGPNVLALGPELALALDGSPRTRRRLARAGIEVLVYEGEEISRKGDGGPTCLTLPVDFGLPRSS
jgi:dimethylargininase